MITNKQMMNGEFTHSEFMRDLIKDAGATCLFSDKFKTLLRKEWDAGNVHFNQGSKGPREFNLASWGARACNIGPSGLAREMKKRGSWLSPATMVCVIKEIARMEIGE